jgi:hypothetical protein
MWLCYENTIRSPSLLDLLIDLSPSEKSIVGKKGFQVCPGWTKVAS